MPIAPKDIEALAEEYEVPRNPVTVDQLRRRAAWVRDETLAIESMEAALKERKDALRRVLDRELVDLFHEVGVDYQGLAPEGNLPAFDLRLKEWVTAKIPDDKKDAAHDWFEENGHGDMVRHVFSVNLGVGEIKRAEKLRVWLQKTFPEEYLEDRKVHAQTLLAFVREQRRLGEVLPTDLLGINAGDVVVIEERKEKKARGKKSK